MAVIDTAWLRNLFTRKCAECKHEWLAPVETGRCPRCHSDDVSTIDHRVEDAKRV